MAVVTVQVTKSKSTVDIDTEKLPQDVYEYALLQGLKVIANRGMSKITKETYPNADELKVAAQAMAEKNIVAMYEGKVRMVGGAKKSKASGAVMTEARRLAKNLIKDEMKKAGIKVSHVAAKDITAAANALLDTMPELLEQAQTNLKAREDEAKGVGTKINIAELVKADPDKVAKAEAKKAAKAGTLSATQAGKPAKRKAKQTEAQA